MFALVAALAPRVSAQDAATQDQIDKLTGQIQDILDAQAEQGKRIDALEKKISDMQDKLNAPGGADYASADDLKSLAQQVQEIDKKRQEDNQKILDAIAKLGLQPRTLSAQDIAAVLGKEVPLWDAVAREANVKLD